MIPMFDNDELVEEEAKKFVPGTFWDFTIAYWQGDTRYKKQERGMVVVHRAWSNEHLVRHAVDSQGTSWEKQVPELVNKPGIVIWTGRHASWEMVTPLEHILKARHLITEEEKLFKEEQQGWADKWIWTQEEWDDKMKFSLEFPDLWWPVFKPDMVCDHQPWWWSRSVLGTHCQYCKEQLDDIRLPAAVDFCGWWTYKGTVGRGTPPNQHPDNCSWCERRRNE